MRVLYMAAVLAAALVAPAVAQRQPGPPPRRDAPDNPPGNPPGYKDPELATVLGLMLPGGGQIYAGRPVKGGILLTLSVASPLAGILGAMAMDNHHDRRFSPGTPNFDGSQFNGGFDGRRGGNDNRWIPIAAGFSVSAISWAYGWATAAHDAREHNRDYGPRRFGVYAAPLENGRAGYGMSIALP